MLTPAHCHVSRAQLSHFPLLSLFARTAASPRCQDNISAFSAASGPGSSGKGTRALHPPPWSSSTAHVPLHPPTGAEIHSAAHGLCSDGRAHMVPPATVTSHQVPAHASTRLAIAMQSMYTLLQLGALRPYKTPFCDGISITQRLPCKFSHY